MATESGNTDVVINAFTETNSDSVSIEMSKLRKMLVDEPFRVRFFQAVRLLQKMEKARGPVGYFTSPQGETIRFASLASLSFPASELYDLKSNPDGQYKMTVQFMGLNAAVSILPAPYTEFLMSRQRLKDHAMEEFFDIFNHRMISLFYRGWEKYRFYVGYERAGEDKLSDRLLDLMGLGTKGMRERAGIPDVAYLNYVGLLGRHVRPSGSLQQILEDYFGVQVKIEQFAGTWRQLSAANQTCFSGVGGSNERLGLGVVAGDEVWDHHGRIQVALGPMRLGQYLQFLPGADAYHQLVSWIRFYSNGNYETEIKLLLVGEDVPKCELDGQGEGQPQLGLVSWLKTKPMKRNPGDATYLIQ